MHYSCFDVYFAEVVAQSEANRGLILNTGIGQFLCPCCKRVANCLVPHHSARAPDRLFKRARKDEAGESGEGADLLNTFIDSTQLFKKRLVSLSPSFSSSTDEIMEEHAKETRFWMRFLNSLTAPETENRTTSDYTPNLSSCAFLRRLEVAAAAVRYTVRCDLSVHQGPGRFIAKQETTGLDEHSHLSSVICSIGSVMHHSGINNAFVDALLLAIALPVKGGAFVDKVDPARYIERDREAPIWLQGFFFGLHRGILSLPTLDLLVMILAFCSRSERELGWQDLSSRTCLSSVQLLCIASLVQVCVAVGFDHSQGEDIYCDVDVHVEGDASIGIGHILDHVFDCLIQSPHFGANSNMRNSVVKEIIVRKWTAVLRVALEIIYRSKVHGVAAHPDSFFAPKGESGLGLDYASTYVQVLGLEPFLYDNSPHASSIKDFFERGSSKYRDNGEKRICSV
jgi:hypothetical protein